MNALKFRPNQELKFSFLLSCLAKDRASIVSIVSRGQSLEAPAMGGSSSNTEAFMEIASPKAPSKPGKLLGCYFHRSCLLELLLLGILSLLVGRSVVASCLRRSWRVGARLGPLAP